YIAATQLGITLASLGLGWIGEPAIAHLIEPLLEAVLPEDAAVTLIPTIGFAVAFSLVTMLHIVLGELAPKTIALQRPEETSLIVARPATLFLQIFRPVIYVMNGIGNFVVSLLGFEPAGGHSQVHSAEELEMLVQSSREAGFLQESEERLLRRVFDFSDIYIEEVMQPRVDVTAFAADTPFSELLQEITTYHHSRYPVFDGTIDKIVGVLYTKDLLDLLVQRPQLLIDGTQEFQLSSILRMPIFVPETAGLDKVLAEMQRTKTHLAIVMDEYGGMAGVATMEDILEELIGKVGDEFDDEEDSETLPDTVLDGLVSITDAMERFGEPDEEVLSTTIGGYISERLERIPVVGDRVTFGHYGLVVEEMDGMRVSKVRFSRQEQPVKKNDEE
ncbi:MAG: HlyC/CorC family transporter, partial [Chitinophagaceae bacterium]|nr:HlyC/CorC family transporter [Anaerolineae bacterium]